MTTDPTTSPRKLCPHCGKLLNEEVRESFQATGEETRDINRNENREIDHRGVVMPRRTRMGGIITPQ